MPDSGAPWGTFSVSALDPAVRPVSTCSGIGFAFSAVCWTIASILLVSPPGIGEAAVVMGTCEPRATPDAFTEGVSVTCSFATVALGTRDRMVDDCMFEAAAADTSAPSAAPTTTFRGSVTCDAFAPLLTALLFISASVTAMCSRLPTLLLPVFGVTCSGRT